MRANLLEKQVSRRRIPMATQICEQGLMIKAMQGSIDTPTVPLPSETQNGIQAITEQRDGSRSSSIIPKVLAGLAKQLAAVYVSLSRPPATERGRTRNAMAKAKHDRFISFLR